LAAWLFAPEISMTKAAPTLEPAAILQLLQSGQHEAARSAAQKLTKIKPKFAPGWALLAVAAYRLERLPEAIHSGERATRLDLRNAEYLANLGAAYRASNEFDKAEQAYQRAIEINPNFATAHYNRANLLKERGDIVSATQSHQEALRLNPEYAEAWHALGAIYRSQGNFFEALKCFEQALQREPNHHDVLNAVAICYMALDRHEDAQPLFLRAIAAKPDFATAHGNLGALYMKAGRLEHGWAATMRAHQLEPDQHRWMSNLAVIAKDRGDWQTAETWFRKALALTPNYASGHSNLLFCLNYHPERTPLEIFSEYRAWDQRHALPHMPKTPSWTVNKDPNRKLRIGYLSPDFRQHAARYFLEPLLENHDHDAVDVFCYGEISNPDEITEKFKTYADHWRSTVALSDDQIADMIRKDQIDIMIDCGGHTSQSRLLALARKPAPLQLSYLLGAGYTSGMTAMDLFIADDAMAPAGTEAIFSERIVRINRIPLAYKPADAMPDVGPLPASANGHITFGYFGRPERLNDQVVATWAAILKEIPGSQLILNSRPYLDDAFRKNTIARFVAQGVEDTVVQAIFTTPQTVTWESYNKIDIALDPFPHNAGTTTIEALWMGVPVVSLAARPTVGRFGASILGAVGRSDWVATSLSAYIEIAVRMAKDRHYLDRERQTLRSRFQHSPLYDGADLARTLEDTLRTEWRAWCARVDMTEIDAAYRARDYQTALQLCAKALVVDGKNAEVHHLRSLIHHYLAQPKLAAEDIVRAINLEPKKVEWLRNGTALLRAAGRLEEAEKCGLMAVALDPNAPYGYNNLGNVLKDRGKLPDAEAVFRKALAIDEKYGDAWSNLAWVLNTLGRAKEAEVASRNALQIKTGDANAINNLGTALLLQERLTEASEAFLAAVRVKAGNAMAYSNYLFCLNYRTDLTAEKIAQDYRQWDTMFTQPVRQAAPAPRTDRQRLRVGYVSPDFRHHAVSFFIKPLLAAHDRSSVEVICINDARAVDGVTEQFKAISDGWVNAVGMTDVELADKIREMEIDVLVDLAGHTAGNRLLMFSRTPAPIQIAHMVGSGVTTGLSVFDGYFTDHKFVPEGFEPLFSEPLVRLPRIPLVYQAPNGMPEVAPLPARKNGFITFGCFSRLARINDEVIEVWSQLLKRVPESILLLNSKPLQEASIVEKTLGRFAKCGISKDRLRTVYTQPQPVTWAAYDQVDIALDPFPHNAGTTTIEALWLGVPVVSLKARPPVGRFGASILATVGLADLAAPDCETYIARAVELASDIDSLEQLRKNLRPMFQASPLCDAPGLARLMEEAYWSLHRAKLSNHLRKVDEQAA
jgi:predicted O-linked N-acetylglucosamine transferase (SPINDLY family)